MTFSLAICYKSDSDEADFQQQQRLLSDLYYYHISYIKFSLAVYYKATLMKQTFSIPKRLYIDLSILLYLSPVTFNLVSKIS